ncbi:MAG: hypothetical protein M1820_006373 [Bogoriella megaspora]|nr:MAG: hypothetical protein M1820_006373 [Bogoriella megaspora]
MAAHDFLYPILQNPGEEIRLLEIVSVESDDLPIECKLTAHKQSDALAYAALSYEWGTEPAQHPIHLNSSAFLVRRNLYECLKRLRSHQMIQYYWIDVICINQADLQERGAQVSAMGSIYHDAKIVLAWIGPATGDDGVGSTAAISFLKEFYQTWESLYLNDPNESKAMSLVVANLCNRSYWRRLWIIQEIVLARRGVIILCGNDVLEWDQLGNFFRFMESRHSEISEDYRRRTEGLSNEDYQRICDDHHEQESPHNRVLASDAKTIFLSDERDPQDKVGHSRYVPRLIKLLERHLGRTLCYDLRDKIFGLLGLDPSMRDFVPNYHDSPWELYVRVLAYLQPRYPLMPALHVSQILQKALLLQSHELPVYEAVRSLQTNCAGADMLFRDSVRLVGTVLRVGAAITPSREISPENLEAIIHSLGVQWTDSDRSFSGRDFSDPQKSMLFNLATREDTTASSTFNLSASSSIVLPSNSEISPMGRSPYSHATLQSDAANNRFFLTKNRIVGLAGASVLPGDIICQAFGSQAPMFVIRKPPTQNGPYSLISRCYAWLLIDEYEQTAAREDDDVDLLNIADGDVSDTYWAPQVIHMSPVWERKSSDEGDFELYLDLETLSSMSALSESWICAANEFWYRERTGNDVESERFLGRLDRVKMSAQTFNDEYTR